MTYYSFDMLGVDLAAAFAVAAHDPLGDRRDPIVGWTDGLYLAADREFVPRPDAPAPMFGRAPAAIRTLLLYAHAPTRDVAAYRHLPAPMALADLVTMVEHWLAGIDRNGFPRREPCDGTIKATHRIVHPGVLGVWDFAVLAAVQPAWAYYHK